MSTLAEPSISVTRGWIARLSLANLGFWVAVLTPIQVLLPTQIERLDPAGKETQLAIVTACAAIVSIIVAPIAGALSDRTLSRWGRRRPWIAGGVVLCALSLVALPFAAGVAMVAVCWSLAQAGQNALFAGMSATVPDQVPVRQRGIVSAFVGLPAPLGLVFGVFLVTAVVPGLTGGYLVVALALVLLTGPFLLGTSDDRLVPAERPVFTFRSFWISPRRHPDFAWAAISRLAIQLANSIATLYLLYFLRDVVRLADPGGGVFVLTLLYTGGILLTSVVAGKLSDRSGKRKIFVVVSSVVIAAAMLILAVWHTFPAAMTAAFVLGLGYGVYVAIDNALITQVLPGARDRAKDLGVINIANTAPQAFAPLIAGGVIAFSGSYTVLYLIAGAVALIGALLVRPIKGVA
ncbi:MFS transporter [Amycolatopsis sp. NPDC059657]|uniref:MFS transporter n=1 Tax=Amycolatopsis sp. NPDC059657 TaxID=3346899 RepID=UPI00366F708B